MCFFPYSYFSSPMRCYGNPHFADQGDGPTEGWRVQATAGQCPIQDFSSSKETTAIKNLFCSASYLAEAFWLGFISCFLICDLTNLWKKLQAFLRLLSSCYQCHYLGLKGSFFFSLESVSNPIYRGNGQNKQTKQKIKQQQQKPQAKKL